MPPEAHWSVLQAQTHQPTIVVVVNDTLAAIECDTPALKDALPKDYARTLGHMLDRTRRDLSAENITRIAHTYHAWRQEKSAPSLGERLRRRAPRFTLSKETFA